MSEINLSDLERTFRIDSEFYMKPFLETHNLISSKETLSVSQLSMVSDGNHMSISDKFIDSGISYYRGKDIHSFFIENANPVCIDNETYDHHHLKRSHLKQGDVLLSIVGTIGGVALVSTSKKATCNCKLAILRPKDVNGYYLSVFLKTDLGQKQIKRFTRGAVQQGLILEDLEQIFVPILSNGFQGKIERIVFSAKETLSLSKDTYTAAEALLLEDVGLHNITPDTGNVNVKSFSDSFTATGRLDAEYYLPKYEQAVTAVKKGTCDILRNIADITKSVEPGSAAYADEGLPFMRVSDYSKYGITPPAKNLSADFCKKNEALIDRLKIRKDTVLLSKDGTVGIAYHVRENSDMVTSGAVLHLRIKDSERMLPEYLTLVLNSPIVQLQAERDAGGSIILHWRVGEIENLVIPEMSMGKQQEIATKVRESFRLRETSEALLEIAKRAVEIAIEQDEAAAEDYITVSCADLGVSLEVDE